MSEPMLSLDEARRQRRCRICGERIEIGHSPLGFEYDFREQIYPQRVTFKFGREFAHTDCLESVTVKARPA